MEPYRPGADYFLFWRWKEWFTGSAGYTGNSKRKKSGFDKCCTSRPGFACPCNRFFGTGKKSGWRTW